MHTDGSAIRTCLVCVCAVLTKSRQEFETCQLSARGRLGTQEPRRAVHCTRSIDFENILSVTTVQLYAIKPGKNHTRKILSVPFSLWVHCSHQPSVYGCIGTHGTR